MTEWLESGINKYCLRDRFTDKDETWELWQGFREIAMLRYKTGPEIIDFNGEWLGWGDLIPKLYLEVRIPAQVEFRGRALEEKDVESLAAKVHLVLCSMKHHDVVVRQKSWPPLPEPDRERVLEDFQQWMEQRGWKVTVDPGRRKDLNQNSGMALFSPESERTRNPRSWRLRRRSISRAPVQGTGPNCSVRQRGGTARFKLAR